MRKLLRSFFETLRTRPKTNRNVCLNLNWKHTKKKNPRQLLMYTSATDISSVCVHCVSGTSHPNLDRGVVQCSSAFYRRNFLAKSRQILTAVHVTSDVNKVVLTHGSYQVHQFPPVSLIPQILYMHSSISRGWTMGTLDTAVPHLHIPNPWQNHI